MRLKYKVIARFSGKYPIGKMCAFFEVSRSGYYAWLKEKPNKDEWLESQIRSCQEKSKCTYGYRRVKKWIYRITGKKVNGKAVLRVMRKINLLSKIRRARPFTRYKTAVYKYPNLLQRQFNQTQRNQFWATDVTYIPTKEGMNYMCAVIDLCGKIVVGYKISKGADINLVSETIKASLKNTTTAVKIHSDQGFQYTSEKYHELSKEYGFEISMSRRGCPLDNAAMENFFGILKTECLRWLNLENLKELTEVVDEYIHFYNYERINKEGLTPYEIWSKTL